MFKPSKRDNYNGSCTSVVLQALECVEKIQPIEIEDDEPIQNYKNKRPNKEVETKRHTIKEKIKVEKE